MLSSSNLPLSRCPRVVVQCIAVNMVLLYLNNVPEMVCDVKCCIVLLTKHVRFVVIGQGFKLWCQNVR